MNKLKSLVEKIKPVMLKNVPAWTLFVMALLYILPRPF